MNKQYQKVLQPFIEFIKSYEPLVIVRCEHENFFHSFGWDIQEGPGEVCEAVKDLLISHLDSLPQTLIEHLWWQTSDGRLEKKYINALFESPTFDTSKLDVFEYGYVKEDIVLEELYSELHIIADKAYSEFEKSIDN